MRIAPVVPARVGVDVGAGEVRHLVEQRVPGPLGDLMPVGDREALIDGHFSFGVEPVADPTQPHPTEAFDARHLAQHGLALVDDRRIDCVHHPEQDIAGGVPQNEDDDRRDQEARERIGGRKAQRNPDRAGDDAERGKAVGPRVEPVGYEGGRADLASDPDPELSHSSLPAKPTTPASPTTHRSRTSAGWSSRSIAW